jgi:hypothetical protein
MLKDRRRPSPTNVIAALFFLWLGATCYGCTYVAPAPVSQAPAGTCVILTRNVNTDSLVVGTYAPPCDQQPDSVFYWQLEFQPKCALHATFDPKTGRAEVRKGCPQIPSGIGVSFTGSLLE